MELLAACEGVVGCIGHRRWSNPGHALAQADQVLCLSGIEAIPDHRQEFRCSGEEPPPGLNDQAVDSRRS